ncbi:hypothetical protein Enr8_21460 [Blastopirellula retiformator]|uniref:Uncharacterized protein n=1 Tax=Blastopirellula retiformator TaxID=2527970 RepID=A0A5C5VAJ0_9BACT|nr:hypothetical protein Enr8_21460 [Blastopirellula retiformator]
MSRLTLLQGLLLNFKGEIEPRRREYLPKKEAYEQLKLHTGQDFGEDIDAWQQWIQDHPTSVRSKDASSDASRMVSNFLSKK